MAGAGYKLFNTGDVLTAAQVNTYLQEQVVMVFANAAARTTALSSVLAEGMMSYLQDTNAVEVYNGSAWVGLAGAGSPLTTKGDIYTYSTTNARLAVGSNGDTLVADSAATTGLRWQATDQINYLINGNFDIWQRGTSFSSPAGTAYTADRWNGNGNAGGTTTISQQTTGAPNGSRYVLRTAYGASSSYSHRAQILETGLTAQLWGKTVTFSVKLRKNASFAANLDVVISKSSTVDAGVAASWTAINTTTVANASLPTGTGASDWYLATVTATIPNDGTANTIKVFVGETATGSSGAHWEMAQAQLELGSVASGFRLAGGTIQGELAACQRYYYRVTATNAYGAITPVSYAYDASNSITNLQLPVTMRIVPTAVDFSTLKHIRYDDTNYTITAVTLSSVSSSPQIVQLVGTITGAVAGQVGKWAANNLTTAFLGLSAEL